MFSIRRGRRAGPPPFQGGSTGSNPVGGTHSDQVQLTRLVQDTGSAASQRRQPTGSRAAARQVGWSWCRVGLGLAVGWTAGMLWTAFLWTGSAPEVPPLVAELDRIYLEHGCAPASQPQPDAEHGWQLAWRADGRVELLPPGTPRSAWQPGDAFAGWCRP